MKFYYHHIGDFNNATRHLTLLERGIYRDMLDLYYDSERPLMLDVSMLCRKLMARTEDERAAVINILGEFFFETQDGWRNERCDAEIVQAQVKIGAAEEKRENEKERQRRHRDRRKSLFDQLREYNDIPSYDTSTEQLQLRLNTHLSRVTNGRRADDKQEHPADATTNNNPQPTTHNPQPNEKPSCAAALDDGGDSGSEGAGKPKEKPPVEASVYTLPLNTGEEFGITAQRVAEFGMLYPAVDVMQELRSMRGWLTANPTKRKTKAGIMKFVNAWLSKRQDSGGAVQVQRQGDRRDNGRPSMNASFVPGADDDIFNQMRTEYP